VLICLNIDFAGQRAVPTVENPAVRVYKSYRMRKNIVVIEDDKDIVEIVRYFLEKENYRVHVAEDGLTGLDLAKKILPNLVLLDLALPKMNGFEVCKRMKRDHRLREIPLIMVTGKDDVEHKVEGLELGADDYITKPFHPPELIARVRANLRKQERTHSEDDYQYCGILMDTLKREVRYNNKEVSLTAKEFELLCYLMENKGRVLTREMILNHVWGYHYFGTTRTVDVHITHLRQKISCLASAIATVKPLGYKLKESAEEVTKATL
jgi:two-component system alkaline phosphatase synthesis response regulator PhoP